MNWEHYRQYIRETGELPEGGYILGIDLGTTNSIISYFCTNSNKPEPIDVSGGFGKIPTASVVQYRPPEQGEFKGDLNVSDGEWVIGDEAYRSMQIYPDTTVRSIKRKMGTNEKIKIGKDKFLPEEISAKILEELIKQVYNLDPNAEVLGIVVSVPYDFDDAAKKATIKAVELAGLKDKLICLIEEPKAAALAYNFKHELQYDEKIMVFDFGGGTLDITVFHVVEKNDALIKLQVIAEGGEFHHGGDNVDETLLQKFGAMVKEKTGMDMESLATENQLELAMKAREAKERLSGVKSFRVPFTFCIPPFMENLTRDDFEELNRAFIDKTKKLVLKALREAYKGAISPYDIDRVLLEGGSSGMTWVKGMLTDIFNDESKIFTSDRPALDISIGATYYAAMKMGIVSGQPDMDASKQNIEFDVTVPHDIGVEIHNGAKRVFFPIIRRGTSYHLAKKSHLFTLSGETEEDMTAFSLKIMERMDKDDKIETCKLIGEVDIVDLPIRPSGKTRLNVTLIIEEESGTVKGVVEDLGCGEEYESSGYKSSFDLNRFDKTIVGG